MQAPPDIFIKFSIRRQTTSEINPRMQKAELPEAARLILQTDCYKDLRRIRSFPEALYDCPVR